MFKFVLPSNTAFSGLYVFVNVTLPALVPSVTFASNSPFAVLSVTTTVIVRGAFS